MTSDKDSAGDKLEVANAVFQADYQRWHVNKKHELKQCIGDMAARNISYYDTVSLVRSGVNCIYARHSFDLWHCQLLANHACAMCDKYKV